MDSFVEARRREFVRHLRQADLAGRDVVLVDLPLHLNIGDSLIAQGELLGLREVGARVRRLDFGIGSDLGRLRRHVEGAAVLIHGGGNFGTIWSGHQRFRERVVAAFPENDIVQLPQTVYFDSGKEAEESFGRLRAHARLVVMVRDEQSKETVERHGGGDCRLVPDAAFGIGSLPRKPPRLDVLVLARSDRESATDGWAKVVEQACGEYSVATVDWGDLGHCRSHLSWPCVASELALYHAVSRLSARSRDSGVSPRAFARWLMASRVAMGRQLIGLARVVVTDRLHAHILSVLMGVPNVVIDTAYGKIGRFMKTWATLGESSWVVDSAESAGRCTLALLKGDT